MLPTRAGGTRIDYDATSEPPTDPQVCSRKCSGCEGVDHHWMDDCDEETGDPINVCKHCDAVRPYRATSPAFNAIPKE